MLSGETLGIGFVACEVARMGLGGGIGLLAS